MPSSIAPSIGRKVWFWADHTFGATIIDTEQACDATVIFVADQGSHLVNLSVTDHMGNQTAVFNVPLRDPDPIQGDKHFGEGVECYATWMPYQIGVSNASKAPLPATLLAPDGTETKLPTS